MKKTVYEVSTISPRHSLVYCARFINEKDARDKYAEQLALHPDCKVDFTTIDKKG